MGLGVRTYTNSTVIRVEHTSDFVWDLIIWTQVNTEGGVEFMPAGPNQVDVLFEKPESAMMFALKWR
jgi:hypothetical protein